MEDFLEIEVDSDIDAVVIGWDMWINFYSICYASKILQTNPSCKLITA